MPREELSIPRFIQGYAENYKKDKGSGENLDIAKLPLRARAREMANGLFCWQAWPRDFVERHFEKTFSEEFNIGGSEIYDAMLRTTLWCWNNMTKKDKQPFGKGAEEKVRQWVQENRKK